MDQVQDIASTFSGHQTEASKDVRWVEGDVEGGAQGRGDDVKIPQPHAVLRPSEGFPALATDDCLFERKRHREAGIWRYRARQPPQETSQAETRVGAPQSEDAHHQARLQSEIPQTDATPPR